MQDIKPSHVTEDFDRFMLITFTDDGGVALLSRCSLVELIKAKAALNDAVKREVEKCDVNQRAEVANFERTLRPILRAEGTRHEV